MDINWTWSGWKRIVVDGCVLQHDQTLLDRCVGRVEIGCPSVGVDGVGDLVVARLVEAAQIIPHLADKRVETDRTGVCVEGVAVLIDLIVKNTD